MERKSREQKMNNQGKEIIPQTDMTKLSRELRVTRIFCMISSFLTVLVLVVGIFFFLALREAVADAEPVIQQIAALDVDGFNLALEQLNTTLETVDLEQVSLAIEQLDVDALNTAIENLDTAELSKALENLNNAVNALEQLGQIFSRFTSFFQ